MPVDAPDEQSYWSDVVAMQTIHDSWNQIDRGWRAIILGTGFLILTLAHIQIPW